MKKLFVAVALVMGIGTSVFCLQHESGKYRNRYNSE